MPVQQMNITLSPQMARFIRAKVETGEYTNISEVIRDAVRRMQEVETNRQDREWLAGFEEHLPNTTRTTIARKVRHGIKDIEAGHYQEYDAAGLRGLAKGLVAASSKKRARRSKAA
jgi:putative addiction module CopG family antidote